MSASYSERVAVACPLCGNKFEAELWMIVDAGEEPGSVGRPQPHEAHRALCTRCGNGGEVDAPLLVYSRATQPRLAFTPARGTTPEQDIQQASTLLQLLREGLADAWRDEWLPDALTLTAWKTEGADLEDKLKVVVTMATDLCETYYAGNDTGALQGAAKLWQGILSNSWLASLPHNFQREVLNNASVAYLELYKVTGRLDYLNQAVELLQRALQLDGTAPPPEAGLFNNLGLCLMARYHYGGDGVDLDGAVEAYERATLLVPDDPPVKATFLVNLAGSLRTRHERGGGADDLERATDCYEQALALTPPASPVFAQVANNFALSLHARYNRTGEVADLERAVELWQQSIELTPATSSNRALRLNNLGLGLQERYKRVGDEGDLRRAVECYEQAVALTLDNSIHKAAYLNNLGNSLVERFNLTREAADVERSVGAYRHALKLTPLASPHRALFLANIAEGLWQLYASSNEVAHLDQAAEALDEALRLSQARPDGAAALLKKLTATLLLRYQHTSDAADHEKFLTAFGNAAAHSAAAMNEFITYLLDLGTEAHKKYLASSRSSGLDEAIKWWSRAAGVPPPELADRVHSLNNVAAALAERYVIAGELADLERAIDGYGEVLRLTPPDWESRSGYLSNLGHALNRRYQHKGDVADLEKGVEAYEQAVQLAPPNSTERAERLSSLGATYHSLFKHTGKEAHMESCLRNLRQAVDLVPPESPLRPRFLNNLGLALQDFYTHNASAADLKIAIELFREAMRTSKLGDYSHDAIVGNLGRAMLDSYNRFGNLADLDQSIHFSEEAIKLAPPNSPFKARYLTNLGLACGRRSWNTGDLADLDRAIECYEEAARLTPPTSPERGARLNNLAVGRYDRYKRTRDVNGLEQAISLWRQSVQFSPPHSPDWSRNLVNLANGLTERYEGGDDLRDIEEALACYEQAFQFLTPNSIEKARYLLSVGLTLSHRILQTGEEALLAKAVDSFREACELGLSVSLEMVLESSKTWLLWELGRENWAGAALAASYGLRATGRLFKTQLLGTDRAVWLSRAQMLPAAAAYALARNGESASAVLTLESGRTRLLAEALERRRADLKRLSDLGHYELYERYRAATQRLSALEVSNSRHDAGRLDADEHTELQAAREGVNAAVEEIQRVPGYEDFFSAPDYEEIRESLTSPLEGSGAAAGIYLTLTYTGGLALIVHPGGVKPVWLDFTDSDLSALLVKRDGGEPAGGYLAGQLGGASLRQALDEILPVLGEKIITPIVSALADDVLRVGEVKPTLILIPTGRLSLVPLHAAYYDMGGGRQTLLDNFTVVYAPSARARGRAREALATFDDVPPSLYGLANPLPLPAGVHPLSFARPELEEIAKFFDGRAKLLYETEPVRSAVDAGLDSAMYLHFACHGRFDPEEPLASGLLLSGGEELLLTDLLARPVLTNVRLAVLSACQTAMTDFHHLPEESVGLPSGFLQAGVPGVIGTLWPVNDLSTMLLIMKFYEYHLEANAAREGPRSSPAPALRQAQLWLRGLTNDELSELFRKFRRDAPDAPQPARLPYAFAQEEFRKRTLSDPHEQPFAHPYYWAPFIFYGA